MSSKEVIEDFSSDRSRQISDFDTEVDTQASVVDDIGDVLEDPMFTSNANQTFDVSVGNEDEEPQYYAVLLELLLCLHEKPLTAEIAQDVLERHGLEGLMVLTSDDNPEIEGETAAIDQVFEDLIDPAALSRELST